MTEQQTAAAEPENPLAALTEEKTVAVDSIHEHPKNARRGNVDAIKESIRANGFYGRVMVQKSSGSIIYGNHRFRAAKELGYKNVKVEEVDIDDAWALRILAADNRTSELGTFDEEGLIALLQETQELNAGSLLGTAYDDDDLDDLIANAAKEAADASLGDLGDGQTPRERLAQYESAGLRSVVLPYNKDEYEYVLGVLGRLRRQMNASNNSVIIIDLLKKADKDVA